MVNNFTKNKICIYIIFYGYSTITVVTPRELWKFVLKRRFYTVYSKINLKIYFIDLVWVNFYFIQRTIHVVETIEMVVTEITESYVFFGIDTLSIFLHPRDTRRQLSAQMIPFIRRFVVHHNHNNWNKIKTYTIQPDTMIIDAVQLWKSAEYDEFLYVYDIIQ